MTPDPAMLRSSPDDCHPTADRLPGRQIAAQPVLNAEKEKPGIGEWSSSQPHAIFQVDLPRLEKGNQLCLDNFGCNLRSSSW
jgi:hypothetical protein